MTCLGFRFFSKNVLVVSSSCIPGRVMLNDLAPLRTELVEASAATSRSLAALKSNANGSNREAGFLKSR